MPLERTLGRRLPHDAARLGLRLLQPGKYATLKTMRDRQFRPFLAHDCLFVHIPKCAGTSVVDALFGQPVGNHRSIASLRMAFSADEYRRMFKFTFVRNPWDRLVSTFFYLRAGGQGEEDRAWADRLGLPGMDFRSFVMEVLSEEMLGRAYHFRPQAQFVTLAPDRPVEMDFVGRFETLARDFEHIRDRLGIEAALPARNRGNARPASYREAFDDETRLKAGRLYARDAALFGYAF
jgi:hypothetical protein